MPWDTDGQKRNIFRITLSNDRHAYTFDFGSSVADSCKETTRPKIESSDKTEIFFGFKHNIEKDDIIFSHTIKTSYPELLAIKNGVENADKLIDSEKIGEDFQVYVEKIKQHNTKMQKKIRGFSGIRGSNIDDIYARIRKRISDFIKEAETETETFNTEQAETIVHPSAYDVLTCLTKSDPGDFENFCSEYGYDTDSRSAMRTYKSVRKEWQNVSKLFSETEIEQLQEIQ